MRILLMTHLFSPSIGGIETMSLLLARAFADAGHDVRIVTTTPSGDAGHDHGLTVLRRPGPLALLHAVSWCDVCFHNNISLLFAWPALLLGKPWVVTSQTWIARVDGALGWREHLKRLLLRHARPVAISRAIADALPVPSLIIPNSYDSAVFHHVAPAGIPRSKDLIFVGRLVSDKGAALALLALTYLREIGLSPTLTIVGDGPERERLVSIVAENKLDAQVVFLGPRQGAALAREFHRHRIQLVPSRWAEPFGIVALEGAACGCLVIGSADGGLSDAIGPCGHTFPNGDARKLANLLEIALRNALPPANTLAQSRHLHRHDPSTVTAAYLDLFKGLVRDHP